MGIKKERPTETCALCHETKKLKESHIIPKFVFRHLSKTSHGAIRRLDNPNKVNQDSEKYYMLCSDCEYLFNICETKFANKFFYPYQKDGVEEFCYDCDTYYFITSVSWRSLYLDILDFVKNPLEIGIDIEALNCLIDRERSMREYLKKERDIPVGIENHIFFFNDIKKFPNMQDGLKPHFIFHRGEGSYTFFNNITKTYATITNMMGIILFTIYNKGEDEYLENTEITNGEGIVKAGNQIIRGVCGNEIIDILERSSKGKKKTSEKQREKIYKRMRDDPKGFLKSKAFEALKKDFNLYDK